MPIKHYLKEIVNNPIYDTQGRAVPFEPLAEGFGVIALREENAQDAEIIQVLEACIKKRIGGVIGIDADTYSKKKKSLPFAPKSPEPPLRVFQSSQPRPSAPGQSAVGSDKPSVPEASFAIGGNRQNSSLPNPAREPSAPAPVTAPPVDNFKPRTGRPRALTKAAEKALAAA